MKIVYIIEWDVYKDSGVLQKINGQISQWRNLGLEVIPIIMTAKKNGDILIDGIHIWNTLASKIPVSTLANYFNKVFSVRRLKKTIASLAPDIIYIRQSIWYPGLPDILKSCKSVMELNTDDLGEIELMQGIRSKVYLFGRKKLLNSISAFLSVSQEIESLYLKEGKPIFTLANGIDLDLIDKSQWVKKENDRPQVFFVGSPDLPWHGVDKIYAMASHIPDADFHLIGPNSPNDLSIPDNLVYHGVLNRQDLFREYQNADVAIGSLAMHRNNLKEGSPLKVREYLAFGLPCIIGYEDTDLKKIENEPYILNIGNHENNVLENLHLIKDFILSSKDLVLDQKVVNELISAQVKEQQRVSFFKSLLS